MDTFIIRRNGGSVTQCSTSKASVKYYTSYNCAMSDISNIEEGELVVTPDSTSTVVTEVVDTVASGNMKAVTSNAVANYTISLATLKQVVANSADFTDFQTRIAAL